MLSIFHFSSFNISFLDYHNPSSSVSVFLGHFIVLDSLGTKFVPNSVHRHYFGQLSDHLFSLVVSDLPDYLHFVSPTVRALTNLSIYFALSLLRLSRLTYTLLSRYFLRLYSRTTVSFSRYSTFNILLSNIFSALFFLSVVKSHRFPSGLTFSTPLFTQSSDVFRVRREDFFPFDTLLRTICISGHYFLHAKPAH